MFHWSNKCTTVVAFPLQHVPMSPTSNLSYMMLDLCDWVGYLAHMGINAAGSVVVAFHTSTRSSSSNKSECMANTQEKPQHPYQVFPIVILDGRMLDLCDWVGYLAHMGINAAGSVVVVFHSTRSSSSNKSECMANTQGKPQTSLPSLSYSHIRREDT
jgi:hypothetical protein